MAENRRATAGTERGLIITADNDSCSVQVEIGTLAVTTTYQSFGTKEEKPA